MVRVDEALVRHVPLISINQYRKILGENYTHLTDDEILQIQILIELLADTAIEITLSKKI